MKHFLICLAMCLSAGPAIAQARTVFFEDFEEGSFATSIWANGWRLAQSTEGDYWMVGACSDKVAPVLASETNKVAYITKKDGDGANTYSGVDIFGGQAHFYRDVHLSKDSIYVLTFDWKSKGSGSTCLKISGSATSYTPTGAISLTEAPQTGDNLVGSGDKWESASIIITHTETANRRLFFTWAGGSGTTYGTPPAVDNIRLTAYLRNILKTVRNVMAGNLKNQEGIKEAMSLTVTGTLDASDFAFMRDSMPVLQTLDISGATIAAYTGGNGTLPGDHAYPAGEIPQNAFFNGTAAKTFLKTVTFPATSYAVGAAAFRECTGLTGSLNLSAATSIGNAAFFFTSSGASSGKLDGVTLSDDLTIIGDFAFHYAFYNATGNLTVPAKVKSIGKYAFYCYANNKDAAHSLTFATPSELTAIGDNAFYSANHFSGTLTVPASVTSIGNYAFNACTGLTSVKLPAGLTSLGDAAFGGCSNLNGPISIPVGITEIANYTFDGCAALDSVVLPVNLTSIGKYAFGDCTDLKSITLLAKTPPSYTGGTATDASFYGVTKENVQLKVPASSVADYESSGWSEFAGITGGGYSVSAKSNTNDLGVVEGLENRFYSAGTVTLTAKLKAGNFINWTSNGAEIGTHPTLSLNVQSDTAVVANFIKELDTTLVIAGTLSRVPNIKICTRITLSGKINAKDIAYMRDTLSNLRELFLDGATIERYSGMEGTLAGSNETYPANMLPKYAFYNSGTRKGKPLVALTLPNNLTAIGESALRECSDISSPIYIPLNVTSIGVYAFYNCSKLTGNLKLPAGLTSIAGHAFNGCRSLTGDLVIPPGVTSVGQRAFNSCNSLRTLFLSKNLTSIGNFAFAGCSGLTSITAHNPVPVSFMVSDSVWNDVDTSSCILYVANSAVEAYRAAMLWESFENIHGAGLIVTAEPNDNKFGTVRGLEAKFYQADEVVNLSAVPRSGFDFLSWTSKDVEISGNTPLELTVTQDTAVVADFGFKGVVTAGQLHAVANIDQMSKIVLESASTLDARDFAFMRDQMPKLTGIDITGASIVAYTGTDGTVAGQTTYAANKIPQESFKNKLLVSAKLPSGATRIGERAFENSNLTMLNLPAGLTAIDSYAFTKNSIRYLVLPENITELGNRAFTDNPFDSVRVHNPQPIAFASTINPFSGINSSGKCPLLVPEGSYSAYLHASVWSNFEFGSNEVDYGNRDWRIETVANNSGWGSVEDISTERGIPDWISNEYYYLAGQTATLKATPASGNFFVNWTDEKGTVLSTEPDYSFTVTGKVKLIANFFAPGSGINTVNAPKVRAYPSPVVNGRLIVESGNLNPGEKIAVYSISGSFVAAYEVKGEKTTLDVTHLPSGSYLLKAGTVVVKFTVIR